MPRNFNDIEPIIEQILQRYRGKWNLDVIKYYEFEDFKQDVKLHIYLGISLVQIVISMEVEIHAHIQRVNYNVRNAQSIKNGLKLKRTLMKLKGLKI
jgi:hypothetical protein